MSPAQYEGSPRPATCQNRRLKLSTIKGSSVARRMSQCVQASDLDTIVRAELMADRGLSDDLLGVHEACDLVSELGREAHHDGRIIASTIL